MKHHEKEDALRTQPGDRTKTKHLLFTPENVKEPFEMPTEPMMTSDLGFFNTSRDQNCTIGLELNSVMIFLSNWFRKTFVLMHGYNETGSEWSESMKYAFNSAGECIGGNSIDKNPAEYLTQFPTELVVKKYYKKEPLAVPQQYPYPCQN